ncbi:ABC transporter substrate-binding protein [Calditerrivibrio nitroreducens]|uniref:Periplasmic binding protein n=1 Tax=Calditerrivibrio nitroreducens (strain DSM 19672 / NBRC 101217 / Yu37-1) TaxID=768670 RepID=E4TGY6_CALNY|nr:helical backbone metal receptor [Calditerrivibrio nitroreducens]ADR19784.1 periplasmic binding protein [Calditerrivibrio nitroreducens DSM 19672]
MKKMNFKRGWITPYKIILVVLLVIFYSKSSYALRIVSLTPSITKQLINLELKDYIVGCTSYCPLARDKNSRAQVVGSVMDINVEAIVRLKPDVIYANPLTNIKTLNKLKNLNLKIEIIDYPKSIDDIQNSFLKIGKLTGRFEEAVKIVDISKNKLEKIKNKYKKYQKTKVFFVIGVNPLFTASGGTYIDDIITTVNGINIAKQLNFGMVSKEFVLKNDPEVILIMDMGVVSQEVIKEFKRHPSLTAVKNNRFYTVNADRLGSPTLPDLIDLIDEIGMMVHKR